VTTSPRGLLLLTMEGRVATAAQEDLVRERSSREHESARTPPSHHGRKSCDRRAERSSRGEIVPRARVRADSRGLLLLTMEERVATAAQGDLVGEIVS